MRNKKSIVYLFLLIGPVLFVLLFTTIILCNEESEKQLPHTTSNLEIEQPQKVVYTEDSNIGICPVIGYEASEKISYEFGNKTYYFCCPMCLEIFKADPDKFIQKIKEINIEAYQFGYFPNEITVNKNDIVKIILTSRDVYHGIHIKGYDIKILVNKGETKKLDFIANKSGEFEIICPVYCGYGHHNMKAKLIVNE